MSGWRVVSRFDDTIVDGDSIVFVRTKPYHGALNAAIEALLPDELFGEVMQGMVDSAWLRERAETVAASGDPFSNEKAAALFEAADAAAALGSPEAAP